MVFRIFLRLIHGLTKAPALALRIFGHQLSDR